MNVLKKNNENQDRFIIQRSYQSNTTDYFNMKEQLEDAVDTDDKMMVDACDETSNSELAYNALLQSEILDIGDVVNCKYNETGNENMPTSLTWLQKFSTSRKDTKKKFSWFEVNSDSLFTQWKQTRHIPKMPFKVLDAPALKDDYYLNLLDWSSKNILAVGLAHHIYLWSGNTGKV